MTATLVVAALVSNFSIGPVGIAVAVGYVGIYAYFAHANARSPKRRDPQVMFVLGATAQLALITAVMAPMTYVAAAIDLPMQDATLLAMDRAIGFDWAAYVKFVDAHPTLASWLNVGYAMIGWPLFAIPVFLAAKRSYQRIEDLRFRRGAGGHHHHFGAGTGDRRLSRDRPRSRHAQEHQSRRLSRSTA